MEGKQGEVKLGDSFIIVGWLFWLRYRVVRTAFKTGTHKTWATVTQPDECEGQDLLGRGAVTEWLCSSGMHPSGKGTRRGHEDQEKCSVAPLRCCFPFKSNY